MNLEEYRERAQEIRDNAEKQVKSLAKEFAFKNGRAKVGDRVTSRYGDRRSIIVDEVRFTMNISYLNREESPECIYAGYVLTKKGVRRKDLARARICDRAILKIERIGEEE